MSRSGYRDDLDQWDLIRWRGAVASAIRGKRGQALLKELEAALLTLPEKKLCAYAVAEPEGGQVCALGAVLLKRRLDKGMALKAALEEIDRDYPEGEEAERFQPEVDVAEALLKEIVYINDEDYAFSTPEKRYEGVLSWVRQKIKADKAGV